MKDYLFIINPIAGRGKSHLIKEKIENRMNKEKIKYDIEKTEDPKNAIDIVKDNIDNYKVFVAVGGDGTIKEVASGLAECKKGKLGILPVGTANDLAKALNFDDDLDNSLDKLLNNNTKYIDVGKANGSYFLNIGSVGYDAQVIVNYNNMKKRMGKYNYYLSVIYTMIKFKNKKLKIKIDNEVIEEDIFLLAAGSGKYYGGGFKILPNSKLDDGYFYVCIIKNISKLSVLLLFPTIFTGKHIEIEKYVDIRKTKSLEVYSEDKIDLNLDGEILGKFNKIEFLLTGYQIPIIY